MLGYVRAYKPDLKIRDYEMYKGAYCTLCRNLGRRYSPLAQLFLSYDFAFAALLRLAAADSCTFVKKRCPYNPAVRCLKCCNPAEFDIIADALIITVYYKLRDNLNDRGFWSRFVAAFMFPIVVLMHKKAKKSFPEGERIIAASVSAQALAEKENASLDRAADASAKALAEIFSFGMSGDNKEVIKTLGYMTGRYVYILDAADDLADDVKKGNFNPFAGEVSDFNDKAQMSAFADTVTSQLNMTQAQALAALDLYETKRFDDILENILLDGLEFSAQRVRDKLVGNKDNNKKREINV